MCGRLADADGPLVAVALGGEAASIGDLKRALAQCYPALGEEMMQRRIAACVDDAIVPDSHVVRMGQRIALFPPLSGG